jgi:hypothetical protein
MQFSPRTATQIWVVAKHLADVMHTESIEENSAEGNSKCDGVEYLIDLGQILAKSVSGYQDIDIANCRWNELPTIPTEKEMLASNAIYCHCMYVIICLLSWMNPGDRKLWFLIPLQRRQNRSSNCEQSYAWGCTEIL